MKAIRLGAAGAADVFPVAHAVLLVIPGAMRSPSPAPAGARLAARGGVAVRDARDLGGPAEAAAVRRLHPAPGRRAGSADRRCGRVRGLRPAAGCDHPGGAPRRCWASWRRSRRAGRRSGRPARWPDCRPRPRAPATSMLIVWDTVRAYNLSLYGYPRDTTPNLTRWARQGVRYRLAPWRRPRGRIPSHSSLLHRPVAVPAQFPVEVHARYPGSDPGRVPGLAGLSDRRVRGEHQLLQLRDRAGSRLRPFRGLPADAAVPPRPHGPREVDPR